MSHRATTSTACGFITLCPTGLVKGRIRRWEWVICGVNLTTSNNLSKQKTRDNAMLKHCVAPSRTTSNVQFLRPAKALGIGVVTEGKREVESGMRNRSS